MSSPANFLRVRLRALPLAFGEKISRLHRALIFPTPPLDGRYIRTSVYNKSEVPTLWKRIELLKTNQPPRTEMIVSVICDYYEQVKPE